MDGLDDADLDQLQRRVAQEWEVARASLWRWLWSLLLLVVAAVVIGAWWPPAVFLAALPAAIAVAVLGTLATLGGD